MNLVVTQIDDVRDMVSHILVEGSLPVVYPLEELADLFERLVDRGLVPVELILADDLLRLHFLFQEVVNQ